MSGQRFGRGYPRKAWIDGLPAVTGGLSLSGGHEPTERTRLADGHPEMAMEGNAAEVPAALPRDGHVSGESGTPGAGGEAPRSRRGARRARAGRLKRLIRAVRDGDRGAVEEWVLRLSRSRRWLAPLALAVGAFVMLFDGVKLLFTNWRLTLIQVLPAMWIWAAMYDLKAHVLRGKTIHVLTGPVVIPLVLAVAAITAASFFLNAVFAFAIASEGPPVIRPAFTRARSHLAVVLGWGGTVGLGLNHAFEAAYIARTVIHPLASTMQAVGNKIIRGLGGSDGSLEARLAYGRRAAQGTRALGLNASSGVAHAGGHNAPNTQATSLT